MTRMLRLPLVLILFCASIATGTRVHSEEYVPLPKPSEWPFYVQMDICAHWAHARGEHQYYTECKDRPIATGTEPNAVWQMKVLQQFLPDGVAVIDLLPNTNRSPEAILRTFEEYLQAAAKVPGARVAPLLDIVLPRSPAASPDERENVAYHTLSEMLKKYGTDPHWLSVGRRPVIVDYSQGGLGIERVGNVADRLKKDGYRFYWITDIGTSAAYTLEGAINEADFERARARVTGVYTFTAPVNESQGGYERLAQLVRGSASPRVFGVTGTPGHYSCRLAQRNYVSARGTAAFREGLDRALSTKADFISAQTWNDYVEGAHVEPSYKHTSAQLEILRHYAEERTGRPHPEDSQPHLIASYRKGIYPGEFFEIELLNLPLGHPFQTVRGHVILTTANGTSSTIPFELSGDKLAAQVLSWQVPGTLERDTIHVVVEAESVSQGKSFRKRYINLPPVPVITSSELADPLTFSVPLHRLFVGSQAQLTINGNRDALVTYAPRLLSASVSGAPSIEGISYMRSGAVINDPIPETATQAMIDNWPEDRTRHRLLTDEYYGALIHLKDGSIAYAAGAWTQNSQTTRVWADYNFCATLDYTGKEPSRLFDRSGHDYHGTLLDSEKTKAKLQWAPLGHLYDALVFDGRSTAINLPGAKSFPIGPITIELLIKPDEIGRLQAILTEGGEQINISLATDGRVRARHANTRREYDDAFSQTKLKQGEWALIVATYDMNTLRLFLDGKLEAEIKTDGMRPNEGARLGAPFWSSSDPRGEGEGYLKGEIARFRILDGATSESDIGELYLQMKRLLSK